MKFRVHGLRTIGFKAFGLKIGVETLLINSGPSVSQVSLRAHVPK